MRKLSLILFIAPYLSIAQSSVKVNFNSVYVGQNISFDFDYQINRYLFSIGAVYYPGIDKKTIPFNSFYRNRGAPANTIQHFGFQYNIGYRLYRNSHFDLYGVYRGSLASMNTYIKLFQIYTPIVPEPQMIEDYAVTIQDHEFGPVFSFDNTFGLLFRGKITKSLFFNLQGGVGFTYLKNTDETVITPSNSGSSQICYTFSIGLGYSFENFKN